MASGQKMNALHKLFSHHNKGKGGVPHIPDMRLVLLGYREAGKSSSGNTILGREEFNTSGRTAECVKRKGETAERRITVVKAPGWWVWKTVEQTPERDKQEIVLSVSLCPPGPHALLLVIGVSHTFKETERRAVQEHLELLGERVWSHTIVLFTGGDCLGDKTIKKHVESEGEALQWVVEKCGNRYHVLDNNKSDGGQVTELLDKIEEMVAGNRGDHYDFDRKVLKELQEKKKVEERRAEERKMKVKKQRETLRSSAGGVPHIPDMRIVLLGYRYAGKSSSGNTILGREKFDTSGRTAECVKREGKTAGRHITVVEAPGWWRNHTVEQCGLACDKREIVLSVSLCPPGPHALLLVIGVHHTFKETERKAVQEHLELLGERVWSHTIVLFTGGDWLGDTTIEKHIESEGEALQWVVEKCGNRYHVLNNKKSDGGQVTELLEKIEEMVTGNSGDHYDFDRKILKQLQENKEEERRAEERKMKVQKQRETLRSSAGGIPHIPDMRIVLLGYRLAGKSSSGNTILGREEFDTPGRTAECVKREGETAGRHITVVEAPGWWRNYTVEQCLACDKREIVLSVSLCPPGPHALLLVIHVGDTFTETHKRAVQEHLELLGQRVWSHTIVLFTGGDWLGDTTIEKHIESGGEAPQWVVEKCGNRYHVLNNNKSDGGQVIELLEKIEEMVAGNSGDHYDFDRKVLKELQEKKKQEVRRAEERKMKVQKQRETLRSSAGGVPHIPDMRIVLLGYRLAGKSSSGKTILGRQEFGLGRTAQCVKREGETAGRHITVVEAPGWWRNYTVDRTPEHDKQEIVLSVSLCPPGPHALLLVIGVHHKFRETERRAVQEHLELLGERVWSHTIVLFTGGDWLRDTTIEKHIESEGEALEWVVEKCGNRYHVVDNNKSDGGQVTELLEKIKEMVAGNRGCLFQIKSSMDIPLNFREHMPDDHSGERSRCVPAESRPESEVIKSLQLPTMADSIQSSGYGTGEGEEKSGSGEMVTVIQRTRAHGADEIAHQDLTLRPVHDKRPTNKAQACLKKNPFVDPSTITVNYKDCIGSGSCGAVYRGSYQGTPAAVKIISIGDSSVITNEFLIPLRLAHPNIVQMIAVARSETQILIANQYIHGANLQQVIHQDTSVKLQYEDKLCVALDIAMAVEYIHGKEIIHQDLKPANIMIASDNRKAYLTDWGMANWKETMSMTRGSRQSGGQCGPLGGTPPYMAPECLVDCEDCSTMSDMWSLGITLLEMFTNSAPWSFSKLQELRRFLCMRQIPHAVAKLQPPTDAIIKPLLEYEPESRMRAKDLVILLKSKIDLTERYGYTW